MGALGISEGGGLGQDGSVIAARERGDRGKETPFFVVPGGGAERVVLGLLTVSKRKLAGVRVDERRADEVVDTRDGGCDDVVDFEDLGTVTEGSGVLSTAMVGRMNGLGLGGAAPE